MSRVLKHVRRATGLEANPVLAPKPARIATGAAKLHVHKAFFPCLGPVQGAAVKVESSLNRVGHVKVKGLSG